jgi:hypothetical protein
MYKCIFENTVYDYLIMPNIILYTGEVLYNKEELSMNEDFDFNKVKKHHIEDEYTIDLPTIVRRNLTNTVNIRDIVDPVILKLFEKYGKKKRYSYPNIGQCLGSIRFNGGHSICIDDDLAQKLEDFGFDYHEEMGYEFNFSDDDYRLKLFDAVITVLTDGRITTCKDDDIMIEYYVSPDKGYIIINPTYFPDNEKIINPKYMKQPIICFTGLVDYSKY